MGHDIALSAFVAGLITRFVIAPLDVVKIRSQVTEVPLKGQIKSIFQKEGIWGFWKGNMSAELLYGSYALVQMTCYQRLKKDLPPSNEFFRNFEAGAIAGMIATVTTFPFDVLRTRFALQVVPVYSSIYDAVKSILKEENYGLLKGLGPSLIAIVPYMGITFASYEYYKKILANSTFSDYNGMVAGAGAGFSGKLATYPLDTLRKRMQVQGPRIDAFLNHIRVANYQYLKPTNFSHWSVVHIGFAFRVFKDIIKKEGVSGLFRGVRPALLKAVIGSSLTFSLTNYFTKLK